MQLVWLGPCLGSPDQPATGYRRQIDHGWFGQLRELDAKGCVLLGGPDYYGRFGFAAKEGLILEDVPPDYFPAWPFSREPVHGIVKYHDAFAICD